VQINNKIQMKNSKIQLVDYSMQIENKIKESFFLFSLMLACIFFTSYVFSIIVAPYHIEGDQVHYNSAYTELANLSLNDAIALYPTIVHTSEPIHLLIVWATSSLGLSKDMVMGFANSILASLFALYLRQKGAGILMVFWLVLSSYYLLTFFFTLERAKFAFIFIFLYLLNNRKWWLVLSVLTHSVILIPLAINMIGNKLFVTSVEYNNQKRKLRRRKLIQKLIIFALFVIVFEILGGHIYDKFTQYFNDDMRSDKYGWWPLVPLCVLTILTGVNAKKILFFYICLILLAMMVGSSRINMFGYFGFLYFSNFRNPIFWFSSVFLGCYFFYKSWVYVENIYYYGG
jgi:hypothetical protein